MRPQNQPSDDEFVTIIGASVAEITSAFGTQGLAEGRFTIVHRTGRHRFIMIDGGKAEPMFEGRQLIAATFARRAGR